MNDDIEEIALSDFLEAHEDLTAMELWDFLVYNGHIRLEPED